MFSGSQSVTYTVSIKPKCYTAIQFFTRRVIHKWFHTAQCSILYSTLYCKVFQWTPYWCVMFILASTVSDSTMFWRKEMCNRSAKQLHSLVYFHSAICSWKTLKDLGKLLHPQWEAGVGVVSALHYTALHYIAVYFTALHYSAYTTLYFTTLHYTALRSAVYFTALIRISKQGKVW